jgi:hypothetical protein
MTTSLYRLDRATEARQRGVWMKVLAFAGTAFRQRRIHGPQPPHLRDQRGHVALDDVPSRCLADRVVHLRHHGEALAYFDLRQLVLGHDVTVAQGGMA